MPEESLQWIITDEVEVKEVHSLKQAFTLLQGKRDQVLSEVSELKDKIQVSNKEIRNCEQATIIVQTVAKKTQESLQYKISELATLAMSIVFEDPYELRTEFVARAGRTEVDIFFERAEGYIDPTSASGGGPVDIASFALRLALWNLSRPKLSNTIILDEPFRFVSKDYQPKASEMLKELSERLNLQIIMVSHNEEIIGASHKVFEISIRKGVSQIKQKEEYVTTKSI